jgi:hypothetical protein
MSSVHPPVSVQLQALYGLPELKALTLGRTREEGQQAIDFFSSRGKASAWAYVQSSEEWAVGVRMMFSTLMQFEVVRLSANLMSSSCLIHICFPGNNTPSIQPPHPSVPFRNHHPTVPPRNDPPGA